MIGILKFCSSFAGISYLADDVRVTISNFFFFFLQNRTIFKFDPTDEDKRKVSRRGYRVAHLLWFRGIKR